MDTPDPADRHHPVRTCFGVACPLRRTCLRYLAIDCTPGASTSQGTCCLDGTYPDYLYAMSSELPMQVAIQLIHASVRAA